MTAVQLLRQKLLNDQQNLPIYIQYIHGVIDYVDNQLLEIEKQQIIDAYIECKKEYIVKMDCYPPQFVVDEAKQYYNETYNN